MTMLTQDPVKIPDLPGKISICKKDGAEYVRYLINRKYNAAKGYTESEWVQIGRKVDAMPGLMYPNDQYEEYFREEMKTMEEQMTAEEAAYAGNIKIYTNYVPFFEGMYYEFRQQAKRETHHPVDPYTAESINEVLRPLRDMMQGEVYGKFLGLINEGEDEGRMTYNGAMILLTKYKNALTVYRKSRSG